METSVDTAATHIGTGRLSWSPYERIGDRYGLVILMNDGSSLADPSGYQEPAVEGVVGRTGTLVAEVIETRESTHIGDIFRGLGPETPEVGERIELGTGELFTEFAWDDVTGVGVLPADGRDTDWMNPQALYRAHEQTVRLEFIPQD